MPGGIQIYRRGIITGTEVNGEELLINGKLWCAKKLEDMLPDITFYLPTTRELIQTVFGNQYRTEEQATKRVEGIIEGYKHQYQEEEKEMKHKISHGRMFYK